MSLNQQKMQFRWLWLWLWLWPLLICMANSKRVESKSGLKKKYMAAD